MIFSVGSGGGVRGGGIALFYDKIFKKSRISKESFNKRVKDIIGNIF